MENHMFVMECLTHVLGNDFKAVVIAVKYDDGKVDTEVTRRNVQHYITWKNHKRGKGFGYSAETCGTYL